MHGHAFLLVFSPPPPPLFSTMLLYSSFFCLLARRLDHETRYQTSCVVFVWNGKRRNNAIANFRRNKREIILLRIFFGRVGRKKERRGEGKSWRSRKIFTETRKSPGQPSNPPTQRPTERERVLLRSPCLGSIDRDRIVSLLPFHSAAFPANPFFCSMHIYV